MRQEIRDKDAEIEFLELLIKEKAAEIGQMEGKISDKQKELRPDQFYKKDKKPMQSKEYSQRVEIRDKPKQERRENVCGSR